MSSRIVKTITVIALSLLASILSKRGEGYYVYLIGIVVGYILCSARNNLSE